MDKRVHDSAAVLRIAFGAMALAAGLDKFFNFLADWGAYVSPTAAALLPVSTGAFMSLVGIVEIAVGAAILFVSPRFGAYAASAWLLLIAGNLALAGYFDIAARDVVLAAAAFSLARLVEAGAAAGAGTRAAVGAPRGRVGA